MNEMEKSESNCRIFLWGSIFILTILITILKLYGIDVRSDTTLAVGVILVYSAIMTVILVWLAGYQTSSRNAEESED